MTSELVRPDHLKDETWAAIEYHQGRLVAAASAGDKPAMVGASKELIECICRCVLDATEIVLGDNADFPKVLHEAQKALKRAVGPDTSMSAEVKAIANAAKSIATSVNSVRNDVGTGHGRARVPDIDDEMSSIIYDATLLWCRWALRRLGHLLAGYPNLLLAEVNTAVGRDTLQRHFNEVRVSDQPADIQHAIGVAFGRQAAGGFWNAYVVGLQPAAQAPDLLQFPVDYRLGLFEGMIIDQAGHIGLTVPYVEDLIGVLVPVPTSQAAPAVGEVAEKVRSATWITTWRGQTVDPVATIEALEREAARLERGTVDSLRGLKEALTVVSEPSQ